MKKIKNTLKAWLSRIPIAKKLYIANIFIVFSLIIIFLLIVNSYSRKIIVSKAIDASIQNLVLVSENLNGLINRVDDISRVIAANDHIQQTLSEEIFDERETFNIETENRALLDNIIAPRMTVSSAVVYGLNNQMYSTSRIRNNMINSRRPIEDSNYSLALQKAGKEVWLDVHPVQYEIPPYGKTIHALTMLRALLSTRNAMPVGIVELNVDQTTISSIYSSAIKESSSKIYLISQNGMILSSSDEAELYTSIGPYDYYRWAQSNNQAGNVFKIMGEEYVVTVSQFPRLNAFLVSMIPLVELTKENTRLSSFLFFIGLAFIIFSSLASIIIAKTITRPISRLANIMEDVGQGDLEVRAPDSGNDEIGLLSVKFNQMIGQVSELMEQNYNDQIKQRKLEMIALQSQIKPHFLYNTLDSVCTLAQMGRNTDVFEMTKALSMFYRRVLSKGRSIITIKEELDIVRFYLTIQKIRYFDKINYSIDCNPAIMNQKIVKLSIQPLVENAIYHGVRNKSGVGTIDITGRQENERIVVSVRDDAGTFNEAKLSALLQPKSSHLSEIGYGLHSVDERIKLSFGKDFGIRVDCQKDKYTRVDLILPSDWMCEDD